MMNWPLRLLSGVALASVLAVWAATPSATVSWSAPTQYVDGTVLPVADIDHYSVSWGPVSPAAVTATNSGTVIVKSLTASVPVACGSVEFSVTATTGANATYPNTTSTPAGPVPYASGVACAPNPPGALAVH